MDLDKLETEKRNPETFEIDNMSVYDLLSIIQSEDEKVALSVKQALPKITDAVGQIVDALQQGGRLFYAGAGTSGRLGVLDAAECPPTFNTPPDLVQALLAGGQSAMFAAVEGAEDDLALGGSDLRERALAPADVLVGLAASGRTPYVIGALRYAKSLGCRTIAVACVNDSEISKEAALTIAVPVGPEVIAGSTRMKAGTAQKMVLNMLSTATMIKLGKTYGNLMVDVRATNAKLLARVRRIVQEAAEVEEAVASEAIRQANGSAKVAILMLLGAMTPETALHCLAVSNGSVRLALMLEHARKERQSHADSDQ